MKEFNIVLKLILPLLIGLFLIASISIFSNYAFLKDNISKTSKKSFLNISDTVKHIIDKDINLMEALIYELKKDQKAINLYNNDQKNWLFTYLHQTYLRLNEKHNLTHFYIHKANKVNYLRIHNKEKNTDFINRVTLKKASETLTTVSGIEFGISHNLTLRVVSPWIIEGTLIGFIELGKEIDLITKEYTDFTHTDIIFTINKDKITKSDFEKWKSKSHRNRYYHSMTNYYIIDSTISSIGEDLQDKLNTKEDCENVYIENDNKKYYVNSKDYYDIENNKVGKFFVLTDVTEEYSILFEAILKVTIIAFFLLSILIWYYFKYIKRTEYKLKRAYSEIKEVSIHDGLTKLYNKQYYLEQIPKLMNKCSRFDLYVSFILIDADYFKKYNDNYGHLKGDDILIHIANTLLDTFKRENDYCFRVGGEEFLVVTASADKESANYMADVLCKKIQDLNLKHEYSEVNDKLTVSIGVVTKKISHALEIDLLYESADKALYKAKQEGRNRVCIFSLKDNI